MNRFQFVADQQRRYGVKRLCSTLGVSRSSFYWRRTAADRAARQAADALIKALRAEGVPVTEVGNWLTHKRNSKGSWGPVNGSLVHHTVSKGTANTVVICRDGYAGLPGPLCHGVIAKDGRVHLVG